MIDLTGAGRRLRRLAFFFVVFYFILSGLLVYWQVVRAPDLVNRPDDPRLYAAILAVHRGAIVDRRGTIVEQTTFQDGYPIRSLYDSSLSPVIGYHSQQYDNSGLESAYNDYLNGDAASQPLDNEVRRILHQPVLGDTLQLTIDDRIQHIANAALGDGAGVALVADPRNGQILAMVSKPTFNASRIDEPGYWASLQTSDGRLLNRALDGLYPPGSIFKTVTLATALADHTYTLQSTFSGVDATGPLFVGGAELTTAANNLPPGLDQVTLEDAFKYSDNIVFANVGLKLGGQALVDGAARFGVGQPIPFDLPVSASDVTTSTSTLNEYNVATSAFGQAGVQVTPLQVLLVDEAIANHGSIMLPTIVQRVRAPSGEVLLDNRPQVWKQALDPAIAQQVAEAMVDAVNGPGASGYAAQLPGVVVAGKTGTAQVGGANSPPHAWFMAFAPAGQPRLAVVVLKENGGEGSAVAAPIARQILAEALPLYH
jgi:peptidoglycan glycosyltransferase